MLQKSFMLTARVEPHTLEALNRLAARRNTTRSETLRSLIKTEAQKAGISDVRQEKTPAAQG